MVTMWKAGFSCLGILIFEVKRFKVQSLDSKCRQAIKTAVTTLSRWKPKPFAAACLLLCSRSHPPGPLRCVGQKWHPSEWWAKAQHLEILKKEGTGKPKAQGITRPICQDEISERLQTTSDNLFTHSSSLFKKLTLVLFT